MSDIADRIGELVDQQLQQESSGYDHNINQDKCWHCGRDWHGLPITRRIAQMYARRTYDETYSSANDDSPVVCPGSDFIGPIPAPHAPHIEAITIGLADRAIQYASEAIANIIGLPVIVTPPEETPTQIQIWDGNFNLAHDAVPVTHWEWSTTHSRARFTIEPGTLAINGMQLLSMILTTENPRHVWRIDQVTTDINDRRTVEVRDVQTELAEIQSYLIPTYGTQEQP